MTTRDKGGPTQMNRRPRSRCSKRTSRNQQRALVTLQKAITYTLLSLLTVDVLSVLVIVFLVGFGKMKLQEKLILTLIGKTVCVAGMSFVRVTKSLFAQSDAPSDV